MKYSELYPTLKQLFDQIPDEIHIPGSDLKIINCSFISEQSNILPGAIDHVCKRHNRLFHEEYTPFKSNNNETNFHTRLHTADSELQCNSEFRYSIFMPGEQVKSKGVIFLFHGLNERQWDKYLPWAYRLAELTRKAVILFPIAFHMNRAPLEWGNPRLMMEVSTQRRKKYPAIAKSSFANAAISTRIQMVPQRFFWSGRQTYSDINQLITQIRNNEHPNITSDSSIDFFAYSIGAFLSEILIMTDNNGNFDRSRLFIFCGGPTLDRMYPVSRYILDSEANIALYSFFIEHLDNECRLNNRLNHYFNEDHKSGTIFRSMLSLHRNRNTREERLKQIGSRIRAIALRKDEIIPPVEVLNTLKGDFRDLPTDVQLIDFPFDYTHIDPFPLQKKSRNNVNDAFDQIFKLAAEHFNS
jgi:hypothetical protein